MKTSLLLPVGISLAIALSLGLSSTFSHAEDNTRQCERAQYHLEKEKLKKRQKERSGYTISEMRKIKDRIERLEFDVEHFCG
ncbi:hypothetical protein BTA51_02345 [Hahella sp. CCB-MM4]|uniref:hypothetical protein n=1 Tax=Hahella sp. (strain CCB-MM4) TaxID=1926491 RepID=UPI000B9BFC65|nr:hypothetical protein [Hahella sp. CCB-MM4]OZG75244.1 hypothetical protein BTA51_02345 [Hahella sp. CCB-MM4]